MRIGHGYDAHRLVPGRDLVLGGVRIDHEYGLLGHSDADALVHALMDALLSAAGLRDIGYYFPDTDPAYRGISSLLLLEKAYQLVRDAGYTLENADCTIIAQRPKLAAHITDMRENIARTMGERTEDIGITATTEEHMGFTGREEGIRVHAVCLLRGRNG